MNCVEPTTMAFTLDMVVQALSANEFALWENEDCSHMPEISEWLAKNYTPARMDWARAHGVPITALAVETAAYDGNVDFLQHAHLLVGEYLPGDIVAHAAANRKKEVVDWAAKSGYPMTPEATFAVMRLDDKLMLEYLYGLECPIPDDAWIHAANEGYQDLFEWAISEDVDVDFAQCRVAAQSKGHTALVDLIQTITPEASDIQKQEEWTRFCFGIAVMFLTSMFVFFRYF